MKIACEQKPDPGTPLKLGFDVFNTSYSTPTSAAPATPSLSSHNGTSSSSGSNGSNGNLGADVGGSGTTTGSPGSDPQSDNQRSLMVKVGAGIGGGLGAVILLTTAAVILHRRRKGRRHVLPGPDYKNRPHPPPAMAYDYYRKPPHNEGIMWPQELDAGPHPVVPELDATTRIQGPVELECQPPRSHRV